jgi:hypothetical protein
MRTRWGPRWRFVLLGAVAIVLRTVWQSYIDDNVDNSTLLVHTHYAVAVRNGDEAVVVTDMPFRSQHHRDFTGPIDFGGACGCDPECFRSATRTVEANTPVSEWADDAFDRLRDHNFKPWEEKHISLHEHVNMVACTYRTRTAWNPSGVWMHISGNNATSLRVMVDGYQRQKRIERYVKDLVAHASEPLPPMVVYISTTDTPCNPTLPYVTFFGKQGVKGIVIPDDTFIGGNQKSWTEVREEVAEAATRPFGSRQPLGFFSGSPTHPLRVKMRDTLQQCCSDSTKINLVVFEKNPSAKVTLAAHADFKYLFAMRGRTATSRDKYLNLLNSTILWAALDDDEPEEPWYQFYHALWKPFVNFVPVRPNNVQCVLDYLNATEDDARAIARRGASVGAYLTQDVVDAQVLKSLRRFAALQSYTVPSDPADFLRSMYYFVKRHYRTAQVMPDDRNPVKFMFYSWLKRRRSQLLACRGNATQTFSYHNQTGCWYT